MFWLAGRAYRKNQLNLNAMTIPQYKIVENNQIIKVLDKYSKLSDEELVKTFNESKDSRLFELIYHRYYRKVKNKCYTFVKNSDEVEDMSQEVFLKLFLKLETYKQQSKFSTWFHSFIHNYCVNHLQRVVKKREILITSALDDESGFVIVDKVIHDADEELHEIKIVKLTNALNVLNPPDKTILHLKYIQNESVKRIQEHLNIQASAVKMRLKRARHKLLVAYQDPTF